MEQYDLMERDGAVVAEQDKGRLAELAANIRASDREDQYLANTMLSHAVDRGRWLTEAKTMVPHGRWGEWLKKEVKYSQSQAHNLMRLFQRYGDQQESLFGSPNSQTLGNLSVTKAIQLLNIPEGPELDKFLEANDVESMSTRELEAALKERDKALAAAEQARAEQTAAEAARDKMSADMRVANERIAGLNAEVEQRTAEAQKAASAAAQLEKDLEELRSRPVEVAVEVDAAAVEAARKETEEKMQAKLEKAKKAQAKAEEARKAAEDAAAAAQRKLEQAQAEAQAIREQAAKAEKQTALASDEDLVVARMLFDQVQELVNKLSGVLMKLRNKKPDAAAGLSRALLALADRIGEVAQG